MKYSNLYIALFTGCMCISATSSAAAADSGTVTLWCKGSVQTNDDPTGSDASIRYSNQEGKAVLDFDHRQFQFLDWGWVPLTTVDNDHISGRLGAFTFESDADLAVIELNRLTGEGYFRYG